MDKPDQAEIFHQKALAIEPQNIHALYDLAHTYSRTGRETEEITLLQKNSSDEPRDRWPFNTSARYLFATERLGKSLRSTEKSFAACT